MQSNAKSSRGRGSKSVGGKRKREDIDKMSDLLRKAREGSSSLFTQSMSKRIEFSTLSLCVYDRHRILINDIFLNRNINTFVSYNDKNLHSWDPETKELISSVTFNDPESNQSVKSISCLCYSREYRLYFACSKDFKLIVFNEHLNLVYQQPMPIKSLVQVIQFYEAGRQLLIGGKEGCFIIDIEIKPHYDARRATLLDPKGRHVPVHIKSIKFKPAWDLSAQDDKLAILQKKEKDGDAKSPNGAGTTQDDFHPKEDGNQNASKTNCENSSGNDNLPVNYLPEDYGSHIKQLQGVGEWVKGLKVFESQNLIVVWKKEILSGSGATATQSEEMLKNCKIKCTKDQIIFYALSACHGYQQGEVWSRYYDPSIKEDFITDILAFKEQKWFVTAHNLGDIHLRKLAELKNVDLEGVEGDNKDVAGGSGDPNEVQAHSQQQVSVGAKSVHVFKGHSRKVTSLAPVENKNTYFVSASVDGKVRIWCLEKMIELYCFDIAMDSPVQNSALADSIMDVKLISEKIYAMIFKSFIEIGLISHLASSYYISKQNITSIGKCYARSRDRKVNNPDALFIAFDDNSIVLLDPKEQSVKSTIYPPPTPAGVSRVFYCTSIRRMFLLLCTESEHSSICVYETGKETGTLEKLQEPKSLKDYEGKSLNQGITCLTTAYTQPPKFDCEIVSDLYKYTGPTDPDYQFYEDPDGYEIDKFLVIGLSKGTIVFVQVDSMDHIFARFSIHGQAVKQIHEIKEDGVFLSICSENLLKIWGFQNERAVVYQGCSLHREVMTIIPAQGPQLLMCFCRGGSELLVWSDEQKQLMRLNPEHRSDEHEDAISCCDSLPSLGRFVTGDVEGLVKIWNSKKQLIREIKFVEPVNSACFLNEQGDILVGHSGNLSRLDSTNYMDRKMEVDEEAFAEFMACADAIQDDWPEDSSKQSGKPSDAANRQKALEDDHQHLAIKAPDQRAATFIKKRPVLAPVEEEEKPREEKPKQEKPKPTVLPQIKKLPIATPTPNQSVSQTVQPPSLGQPQYSINVNPQAQGACQPGSGPHINIQTYDPNASMSATGSAMNSDMKARKGRKEENMKNRIQELRKECVKAPSVPIEFMKNRKKIQAKEKRDHLIKNSTRRMMTEQRIQRNIQRTNEPAAPGKFHDVFVSQAQSQGNILYQHKQRLRSGQSEHAVQTSKHSVGNPLSRSAFFNNSKGFANNRMQPLERSYFSNFDSQIQRDGKGEKISQMQAALQVMAQSANTFSIFDNNSFHGYRVPNHRLNAIVKNQKLEQNFMSVVSQNHMAGMDRTFQSSQKDGQDPDDTVIAPDTSSKGPEASMSQPQSHHYVATVKMHQNSPNMQISKELRKSEEFSLKEENVKENQLAPSGSPFNRNTNRVKLLNSTLQKSQMSAVAGHPEGAVEKRLSALQQQNRGDTSMAKDDTKIGTFNAQQRDSNKRDSSRDNSPLLMSMQNQKSKLQAETAEQAKSGPALNKGSTDTSLEPYDNARQNRRTGFGAEEGQGQAKELVKDGPAQASSLVDEQEQPKEGTQAAADATDEDKTDQGGAPQKGEVIVASPAPKPGDDEEGQTATLPEHKRREADEEFLIQNDEDPTREDLDDEDDGVLVRTKQNGQGNQKADKDGQGSTAEGSKGRCFVIKRVKQQQDDSQGLSAGTITGGGANNKYSTAVVQLDATNSQMSQQQFDMSDAQFDATAQAVEQKVFSNKIRGSNRKQGANQFVSTRLQQRANQLHHLQPHLISNAKIKADFNKVIGNSKHGVIIQPRQDGVGEGKSFANELWSPGGAAHLGATTNQFREASPNLSPGFPKKRTMKSMGAGEVPGSAGTQGDLYIPRNPDAQMNQTHLNQFSLDKQREGLATAGKQYGVTSNIASQKTGLQSAGNHQRDGNTASPQSKQNNHQRLADELMLGNEQVQYGLSSNQTTHRKGGVITSSQPPAGNPIYLKNAITQGTHMPSKGVYNNFSKMHHPDIAQQKPRTAGTQSKRQKKFESLVHMDQRHNGSVGMIGMLNGPPNVHISGYRNNMNNIQMLSNQAKLAKLQNYLTGPLLSADPAQRNVTSAGVVMHQGHQEPAYMD